MNNLQNNIHISTNLDTLGRNSAIRWIEIALHAIEKHGQFHVALSGGSTPQFLFKHLIKPELSGQLNWKQVHIYFGDERFVTADHADSNFRMANETLLQQIAIPPENIHRIITEDQTPEQAAANYACTLQQYLQKDSTGKPCFDLVMLGMGPDGHVASLFPNTMVLQEQNKYVAAVYVEKFASWRISICFPVINNAAHIMLLVAGNNKADVISHVLGGVPHTVEYPVEMIQPSGPVDWFLDTSAAKQMDG